MVDQPESVVVHTPEIPELKKVKDGKVRSIFEFDGGLLLFVASDRISARDKVLRPGIPGKGRVLNSMSTLFFQLTFGIAPNHMVREEQLPPPSRQRLAELYEAYPWLSGRTMVVRAGQVVPIEFIFRAHSTGSFYKAYTESGGFEKGATVLGYYCPLGMKNGDPFPEPIFTPSTKAPAGEHDVNVTYEKAYEHLLRETDLGVSKARRVLNWGQTRGLALTTWGYRYAREHGFILADHKIEVVLVQGGVELIGDELFTPDSSRFLRLEDFERGNIVHYDKEPVREELDEMWAGKSTPPRLRQGAVEETAQRYRAIHDALVV
ncbi:MAG: phosphoribosylaminoimidazolesuccinocarboxamide synthase [Candidatus Woykebacteria bacterium]